MRCNYHTHTWRCKHASGSERAYVEQAIQGGLKVLGFSDHTPYPFPPGMDTHTRMELDQMEDYVHTVLELRREYRSDIEIRLGLEAEYFPEYFPALLEFLAPYPVEYLLLGQHSLDVAPEMAFVGRPSPPEAEEGLLKRYVNLCIQAMETGRFACVAHPDVFRCARKGMAWRVQMHRLCSAMKRLGIPGEINFLGIRERRHYPAAAFWEIAGEYHLPVLFGTDAHQPEKVCDPASERKALAMVEKYGLELLEELPL